MSLKEGFAGPLRDVVNPALFRPAPSSTAFDLFTILIYSIFILFTIATLCNYFI